MPEYHFRVELTMDNRRSPERIAKAVQRAIEYVAISDVADAEVLDSSLEQVKVRAISRIQET